MTNFSKFASIDSTEKKSMAHLKPCCRLHPYISRSFHFCFKKKMDINKTSKTLVKFGLAVRDATLLISTFFWEERVSMAKDRKHPSPVFLFSGSDLIAYYSYLFLFTLFLQLPLPTLWNRNDKTEWWGGEKEKERINKNPMMTNERQGGAEHISEVSFHHFLA